MQDRNTGWLLVCGFGGSAVASALWGGYVQKSIEAATCTYRCGSAGSTATTLLIFALLVALFAVICFCLALMNIGDTVDLKHERMLKAEKKEAAESSSDE